MCGKSLAKLFAYDCVCMPIRVGVLILFLNELLKPYLQLRFWTITAPSSVSNAHRRWECVLLPL